MISAGSGRPLDAWEPWVWELTSAAFWIVAAVPLAMVVRRLRPPTLSWMAVAAALALLSLPVCALHVGWLAVSRSVIYDLLDASYRYDFRAAQLIYELRKDLLSVFALAAIGVGLELRRPPATPPELRTAVPPYRFEVRDGARTRWFAATEIERIEAAGNYVELLTGAGPVLHRATLANVEAELSPHGFVRIHRSRLVRAAAVTATTTTPSGDFEVVLASGDRVGGSRRFRDRLVPAATPTGGAA